MARAPPPPAARRRLTAAARPPRARAAPTAQEGGRGRARRALLRFLPARDDRDGPRLRLGRRGPRRAHAPRRRLGQDRARGGRGRLCLPRGQRRLLLRQPPGHGRPRRRRGRGRNAQGARAHEHVRAHRGDARGDARGDEAEGGRRRVFAGWICGLLGGGARLFFIIWAGAGPFALHFPPARGSESVGRPGPRGARLRAPPPRVGPRKS
jgi:hypothetical protein